MIAHIFEDLCDRCNNCIAVCPTHMQAGESVPVIAPLDQCQACYMGKLYCTCDARPSALLNEKARFACSGWSFVERAAVERLEASLRRDLADGPWDARLGHLRTQPTFDGPLRLIMGTD